MRMPTPDTVLFAWWEAALRGERPPVFEDEPRCGWFRRRFVPGGPWVPGSIRCVQIIDPETGELAEPERLVCEVGGEVFRPERQWVSLASNPITRAAYDALVAARDTDDRMKADLAPIDITIAPPRPSRRTMP